jgi:predicted GIY-YIG superfamily endonuclease
MIKRGLSKLASLMLTLPALEASLRLYRTEQAFIRSVPAGSIFGNKLMHDIAAARPTTLKQLLALRGMGSRRCKEYGRDILKLVGGKAALQKKPAVSNAPSISKKPLSIPRPKPRPRPKPKPKPNPSPFPKCPALLPRCKPKTKRPECDPSTAQFCPLNSPPSVYILELEDGRVYVGSSRNIDRRITQHSAGTGSSFTRTYKPTGVRLPRLGNISGDGDAAERDETLRYMFLRGIPFVRGWKFTQVAMPPEEFDEAEANIRELFDLCRKCGFKGHFITQCRATYDRWGKLC